MTTIAFFLLALTSVVTAASQTLFKRALTIVGNPPSGAGDYAPFFVNLLTMPSFVFALFLYGLAFILWIFLLSRSSLSLIYPIGISLNVLLTLGTARLVLGESLTLTHVAGVFIILAGIFIVTR